MSFVRKVKTLSLINTLTPIEIINNTREGIVIIFSQNKRERGDWGGGKF